MTRTAEINAENLERFIRSHVEVFRRPPATTRNEFTDGEFATWDTSNINSLMRRNGIHGIQKGVTFKNFLESLGFTSDNPSTHVKIGVKLTEENVKDAVQKYTDTCLSPPKALHGIVMFGELKQQVRWVTINSYIRRKLIPGLEHLDSLDALTEEMGLEEPQIKTPKIRITPLTLKAQSLFDDLNALKQAGSEIPKPQKGVKLNNLYSGIDAGRAIQRGNVSNLNDLIDHGNDQNRPLCLDDFMMATGLTVQDIETKELLWAHDGLR